MMSNLGSGGKKMRQHAAKAAAQNKDLGLVRHRKRQR
jgi:hypothetical protein